ncbi:alpha/beta fold hydrolase [Streptomyces sp. NPDC056291]|uniref:alpha/beta fold hydrolase n=1 Tax=Streptomyces sp. NPDC056291 TaxID=3345772 RepID=UPI0035DF0393
MTHFGWGGGAGWGGGGGEGGVPGRGGAGHDVHALTLGGLAEKKDLPAGQRTHVQDIVGHVERHDLRDVVLVGHSYSGIPVGQAAERIGGRLRRVVFVDSNVPVDGRSFLSGFDSDDVRRALDANDGCWPPLPPDAYAGQELTAEQIHRIVTEGTPHPGATLTEPAVLRRPVGELPATYVKCLLDGPEPPPAVAEALKNEHWELVEMDTGHWPMFSRPRELARILVESVAVD